MSLNKVVSIGAWLLAFTASTVSGQTPAWTNERSINQIAEHVYRFGATQNAMFVVTPAGIILVDGSCDNMEWLKSELKRRFNQPVRYAVMSHDHQSHICDMDVFADTAVGIGHVNILPHILREKRRTIIPQILFEDRMEIELGGMKVVLLHLGPTHSDNMIYVHVPSEGVMFAPEEPERDRAGGHDVRLQGVQPGSAARRRPGGDDVRLSVAIPRADRGRRTGARAHAARLKRLRSRTATALLSLWARRRRGRRSSP